MAEARGDVEMEPGVGQASYSSMTTQLSDSVRMAFVGDVALAGESIVRSRRRHPSLIYPFEPLRDCLRQSDVIFVNLEGPIGNQGSPRQGRTALLHNEPEILDWMSGFPCCVCTLANNHTMDYGAEALLRTRELLTKRGIRFLGAGLEKQEANRELKITVNGVKIGVLAFTTDETHVGSIIADDSSGGCSGLPAPDVACAQVSALAKNVDLMIVLLHWGYEYYNFPAPQQVDMCRSLAAAGANFIVGHHPHVQQGCERFDQSLICYSLGNLLLPEMKATTGRIQYRKPSTKQFAILHAEARPKEIVQWELRGGRCDRKYRLIPYRGHGASRFSTNMKELSDPLKLSCYEEFWKGYVARRSRELVREALYEAAGKLLMSDPRVLLRTFSMSDVCRNLQRISNAAKRRTHV